MSDDSLQPFYEGWRQYNSRLVDAMHRLTDEQLRARAASSIWPIWAIAAHVAGARVYWLCGVLKEPGADTTPFTDPASGYGWEDDESTPRRADELTAALGSSWRIVEACLARWTPHMLDDEFTRERAGKTQIHTRQSVIIRLLSHDAYHSGEMSVILGMHGLPEIDLWRPA